MKTLAAITLLGVVCVQPVYASDGTEEPEDQVADRWYTETYLRLGKRVYESNCMACHGREGQGIAADWEKPLADGSYPPPPLNGRAHTWHHAISGLIRTIVKGGEGWGGKMPPFGNRLSEAETIAVIAYFQNWWPEEVYDAWEKRGGFSR